MKAVILAGGLGTRIAEETDNKPKPMVEIGGRPLLWHIMKIYSHYGINDFIICLGYKGYYIKEFFFNYYKHMSDLSIDLGTGDINIINSHAENWKVSLIDTGSDTMTGGRLKRIAKYLDNNTFCLTYGDGLSNINIKDEIAFHKQHGKLATIGAVNPPGRFGVLKINNNQVEIFDEKPQDNMGWINGGFFVLEPEIIKYIENDSTILEQDVLKKLAKDGELVPFKHDSFWMPCDTLRDKRKLDKLWVSNKADWKVWQN